MKTEVFKQALKGKFLILVAILLCVIAINLGTQDNSLTIHHGEKAYADNSFSITEGMYDEYTDTDFLLNNNQKKIQDYSSELYAEDMEVNFNNNNIVLTNLEDDAIVQIVPKELFSQIGNHIYIGKEYGFFIKTQEQIYEHQDEQNGWQSQVSNKNYKSTVIVFDIITELDLIATVDQIIVTVKPLFQYEYAYIHPDANFTTVVFAGGDRFQNKVYYNITNAIVIPIFKLSATGNSAVFSQVETYYLKDISFCANLFNEQAPNDFLTSAYYDPQEDTGVFFTGYDYQYSGIGIDHGDLNETISLGVDVVTGWMGVISSATSIIPLFGTVSAVMGIASEIIGFPGLLSDTISFVNALSPQQISISSGLISATQLYSTKDAQLSHYGRLIKKAGIAINSGTEETVLYKTNSYATAKFKVTNSAQTIDSQLQTRIVREIAFHVVDINNNIQASGNSAYSFQLNDADEKTAYLDSTARLYLLPGGENRFNFYAQFASKYKLKIDSSDDIVLKLNGTEINGQNNEFEFFLNKDSNNTIIFESDEGVQLPPIFSISPDGNLTNIDLSCGEEYLLKLNLLESNVYTISVNNVNTDIIDVYELQDNLFHEYRFENQTMYSDSTLVMPMTSTPKYLLLQGNSTTDSVNVTVTECDTVLALGHNANIVVGKNWRYYKFVAPETDDYSFTFSNTATMLIMGVWNNNLIDKTYESSAYQLKVYNLQQNEIIWIGYQNTTLETVEGSIAISTLENAYSWEIDGVEIDGQTATLECADTYALKFLINDMISVVELVKSGGGNYVSVNNEGFLTISPTCPKGDSIIEIHAREEEGTYFSYKLIINVLDESKIIFDGQVNNGTELSVSWRKEDLNISAFKYTVKKGQNFIQRSVIASSTGKINVLSMIDPADLISTIKITKITINGSERDYDSSYATATINTCFGGGTGTQDDPYIIDSVRHFNNIQETSNINNPNRNSLYYKQTSTLYFEHSATQRGVSFYGTYDGNIKAINNIRISNNGTIVGGLFDKNFGYIHSLGYIDVYIEVNSVQANIGGLIGINYSEAQINAPILLGGSVLGINNRQGNVGGIVGINYGEVNAGLMVIEKVSGEYNVGGIAGSNYGEITGVQISGNVELKYTNLSTINQKAGGYVGYNTGNITGGRVAINLTVSWVGSNSNSTNLAPAMGIVIGYNLGTLSDVEALGEVDTGNLRTVGSWNQAKYAGNRAVGRGNS